MVGNSVGTAYIDPLWWGVEQLFVLKRLFGQFVPEMALKFCLGMFAIHASLSCRETPQLLCVPVKVSIRSCQSPVYLEAVEPTRYLVSLAAERCSHRRFPYSV